MPNKDNTLILGKLDDKKLRDSIQSLVDFVKESTTTMASSFSQNMNVMQNAINSVANSTSNFVNKSNERSNAIKQEKESYDQLAQAKDKVNKEPQRPSTARESFLAFMHHYKSEVIKAENDIKNEQDRLIQAQLNKYNTLGSAIEQSKAKIVELKSTLQQLTQEAQTAQTGRGVKEGYALAIQQTREEISKLTNQIKFYEAAQQQINQQDPFKNQTSTLDVLYAKLNEAKAKYNEITQAKKTVVDETNQQVVAEQKAVQEASKYSEEIKKQAQAIRESKQFKESGLITIQSNYNSGVNYSVLNNNRLSVEEQLLRIQKQEEELARQNYSNNEKITQQKQIQAELTKTQQELIQQGLTAQQNWQKGNIDRNNFDQVTQAMREMNNAYEQFRQSGLEKSPIAQSLKQDALEAQNLRQELGNVTNQQATTISSFNNLRAAIASVLDIEKKEVSFANVQNDSLKSLSRTAKQLQEAWSRLNAEERKSANGQAILTYLHAVESKMRSLKNEMARPVSLQQAMGYPEKTLDDIAQKIQKLQLYLNGLDFSKQKKEFQETQKEIEKLKKKQDELIANNKRFEGSNSALGRSLTYIRNRLAFVLSVGAIQNFVKNIIEIRGQYEMLEKSIQVLTDSAQRGSEIFNQLNQMALNSPFTTIQLGEAARQMIAYGVETNEVVDITRRLADVSAATGQPIERLTYALGQVQSYGYLTALQARSFMKAGVPLVKELAEMYSELEGRVVSTTEVFGRMKDKQISYNDVLKIIYKDTDQGGRFFEYQAKMATTLRVQLSNLTLAWNNMLNDMGQSNQSLITAPIKALKTLFANWRTINTILNDTLIVLGLLSPAILLVVAGMNKWNFSAASNAVYGARLTRMFTSLGKGLWGLVTSTGLWVTAIGVFLYEIITMFSKAEKYTKEINDSVRESVNESTKSLDEFISKNRDVEKSLYKKETKTDSQGNQITTTVKNDLSEERAIEVWGEIKDEINNSATSAQNFIVQLEKIDDVNERVREGFRYVRAIREAQGEIEKLNRDIVITSDLVWGLFSEGLKTDTSDLVKSINLARESFESYEDGAEQSAENFKEYMQDAYNTLHHMDLEDGFHFKPGEEFVKEVEASMTDLINYVNSYVIDMSPQLFNPEDFKSQIVKAQEFFDTFVDGVVKKSNMGTQEAYYFRTQADYEFRRYYEQQLNEAIKLNKDGNAEIYQNELRIFNETYSDRRVSIQEFFSWLKATHRTHVESMVEELRDQSTGAIDWTSDEAKTKMNELLDKFKENNYFAYLDLKDKVDLANMFTVNIGVYFDVDESSLNAAINRAAGTKLNLGNIQDTAEAEKVVNEQLDAAVEKRNKIANQLRAQNVDIEHINLASGNGNVILQNQIDTYRELTKQIDDYNSARNVIHAGKSKQEEKIAKKEAQEAAKEKKQQEIAERKAKNEAKRNAKRKEREEKAAKRKAEQEAKKAEQERLRQQRENEQELAKSLKDEVSLVDKLRQTYDELRSVGVSPEAISTDLVDIFDKSIEDINKSLKKFGLEELSVFDFVDPFTKEFKTDTDIFNFFDNQLKKVEKSSFVTRDALKALEDEMRKIFKEHEIKGMTGIVDNLSNKLKDVSQEYELSLDVEENPELSELFSSMMGIDVSDLLKNAPKSLREYTQQVNDIVEGAVNAYLTNMNQQMSSDEIAELVNNTFSEDLNILDKSTFEKLRNMWGKDSQLYKDVEKLREDLIKKNRKFFDDVQKNYEQYLQKHGDYADKIREIERKKYSDLSQLDDVYNTDRLKATYDYRRKRQAIEQSAKESKQNLDFEQFKESETYIEMFENLDHVSDVTLTMIINKIHQMREELTDLDPSELKKLADYERQLRDQMIKRNPFKNFKKEFKEYVRLQKQRKQIEANAVKAEDEVQFQQKIVGVLGNQLEQMRRNGEMGTYQYDMKEKELESETKKLGVLKKQNKAAQQQVVTLNESELLMRARAASMAEYLGYAVQATDALMQLAQETDDISFQNTAEAMNDVMGNFQAAAQGFAQGGVWGAVAAGVMDLAPKLIKWFSKESSIDRAIQRSEREVKNLQNTLKELEQTADDAYGAITIGAQNAISANKELQLIELERQLVLEQSRKKKKQDKDKIIDLKGQIIDLRNEINNAGKDVVNDMLGISGGSWAEDLVKSMIDAFRQGEDAMEKFGEKWDEMIDNMIMKYIVSTVMQRWWDNVLDGVQNIEEAYTADIAKEKADAQRLYDDIQGTSLKDIKKQMIQEGYTNEFLEKYGTSKWYTPQLITDEEAKNWLNVQLQAQQQVIDTIDERLNQASIDATKASLDYMYGRRGEGEAIANQLKDVISQYYSFGDKNDKSLSQLQQGIQGITEETAGALEAYMNGVSQQVYLQSELMLQIRDAIVSLDFDLQSATNAQILLTLQNSYQVQMAIQTILSGWSTANGLAVRVEMA